ncbi:MAG TPA: c-type cytochrome [Pyrinomonadaceae bacterium]|jgi:hypothetical protein
MRRLGIKYGVGSLMLGLAFGCMVANWTARGTSADARKMGEEAFAVGDMRGAEDLMSALALSEGERVAGSDLPSYALLPAHVIGLQAGQEDKPVEQVRKNIQVLKGLPDSQLFMAMNFMRASLGVSCAYCHVFNGGDNWEWEKDDKPQKRTARRMIQMVFDINRSNFNGEKRVTCYTCHRGQTEPQALPPLPQTPPEGGAAGGKDEKPAAQLPTVDQVLSRYVEALGGRAALEKLKTRVMKGSQIRFDGTASPLEIYQAAPNKLVAIVTTANGVVASGFNGTVGWSRNPRGQRELSGEQLTQMKRTAEFYSGLRLKELYPKMTLEGKEKVGDREAYVIRTQVSEKRVEKLYFDTQTGLLIRNLGLDETILGYIPDQEDFSDYREVDGVKLPFNIQMSYVDPWIGWTRKFTEIKHNVPVEDMKFNIPAAQK